MKGREFIEQLSDNQLLEMKLLEEFLIARLGNKSHTFHENGSFIFLKVKSFWNL
jgi:hypothetical protein